MNYEIFDIFAEYQDTGTTEVIYNLNSDDPDMHIVNYSIKDSAPGRITTLSELFLEWYLFKSDQEKNIKTFLQTEKIDDLFTETEFMDLICGKAYLDEFLVLYLYKKLPFVMSVSKLKRINNAIQTIIPNAYVINAPQNIVAKIQNLIKQHQTEHRNKVKQTKKKYRETHREQIAAYDKQYKQTHKEQINQRAKEYHQAHPEHRRAKDKKYYESHREQRNAKDKEYYEQNKEKVKQRVKEYYKSHREQRNTKDREYYEKNKERITQRAREKYKKLKEAQAAATQKTKQR